MPTGITVDYALEYILEFKKNHPDFDNVRDEMMEIIDKDPRLDSLAYAELVYNLARTLKLSRKEGGSDSDLGVGSRIENSVTGG